MHMGTASAFTGKVAVGSIGSNGINRGTRLRPVRN
jgi:hypothetical protein